MTVQQAVARAQAGDQTGFEFLYTHFRRDVFRYIASLIRQPQDIEDCTQQTFEKLLLGIGKYRPEVVPFVGWLLRVARNVVFDHVRKQRTVPVAEVHRRGHHPAAGDGSILVATLAALPEDQRTVVFLFDLAGYSMTEISEQMGRTKSSIHGLHHRARKTLKAAA